MKTQPYGPFLGINNRLPDFSLATDKGYWLREAENVSITNSGNVKRRMATELVQAMTAPHSLFGDYLVRGSVLYSVVFSPYVETFVKSLASNDPMSYAEFNGSIYFSNGTDSGRIASNGTVYPWAMQTPADPAVTPIAGTLFKGLYQVAISYTNSTTGEEGGVSRFTVHDLLADGGLRISLPGASDGATHINIYVSNVDGTVQFLQGTASIGTTDFDVTSLADGRQAVRRSEAPIPAGSRIFVHNGQLCSCSGADLFYGIPFRPGYYQPKRGRIPFPEAISIAIGNQGGIYVAADKTYFLAGQLVETVESVRVVAEYGAVRGTEFVMPMDRVVGWFCSDGIALADTQGGMNVPMNANIDLILPASGVSMVLSSSGMWRIVSCGWCMNYETGAATTYTGFDFTSASDGYGTMVDGLYLIEAQGQVDGHVGLGKVNFGSENLKSLLACYLGVSSDAPMELRVTTPEAEDYRYDARSSGDDMRIQRVDPGKGLRASWYDLSIHNTEGSNFTLASVSFTPAASGRRI